MCECKPHLRVILLWIISLMLLLFIMLLLLIKPWMTTGHDSSHRTWAMMKDIQVALGHYRTEYNNWPDDPALANANSVPIKLRGPVLKALLGNNPRGLKFVDLPEAKNGKLLGLVIEQAGPELHDPWGTCFFLMADILAENRLPNPAFMTGAATPRRTVSTVPQYIPVSSLVFSAGPDRDPNTWADNITSWR